MPNPVPEALDLLLTRRSVAARMLGEPGPSTGDIRTLITAASRVPDHGKLAPWRFIVYRGPARHAIGARIAAIFAADRPEADAAMLEKEKTRFSDAPVVIGVVSRADPAHPKIPEWEQVLSAGASAMALVTAAHAMGFAAQWLTGWYAYDADALRYLGARDGERLAGFVHVGTPKEPPVERPRPDLDTIVTRWSAP